MLGGPQITPSPYEKPQFSISPASWTACTYAGPATPQIFLLLVRGTDALPQCLVRQTCNASGTHEVTVNGVKANWATLIPQQVPGDGTTPGDPRTGSLSFARARDYVTIDVTQVTNPLDIAERTMALVLGHL